MGNEQQKDWLGAYAMPLLGMAVMAVAFFWLMFFR